MKINWGTSIVIAMTLFVGFIMYFVVTMLTSKDYEHDLVVEEYYKQEVGFQNQLDKEINSLNLAENIEAKQTPEGIEIAFPETLDFSKVKGEAILYRISNKHLDFVVPISLSVHKMLIPDEKLVDGRWNLSVEWNYEGENYLYKKEFLY